MNKLLFTFLLTPLLLCTYGSNAGNRDSLDFKIGQMVMIGINGRTYIDPGDSLLEEIQNGKAGGVVLFEKNVAKTNSADSLREMIRTLQRNAPYPLFVSIDEEGGKVHRLKEKYGFLPMPPAAALGHLNNEDSTLFYNRNLAFELKQLGFNVNYAPDVDMAVNPENTVVVKNGRSFGAESALVAKHATLCILAHREHGIITAPKHFPGHGSSAGDSHFGVTDVSGTWGIQELLPFEQIVRSGNCDAVMVGHMVNSRWDADTLPATLSERTVNGLLRGLLGFKGLVFSDDMQMQAITDHYGLEKAIQLSVNAGVDVLLFCNTSPDKTKWVSASEVHRTIRKLVRKRKISRERVNEAYGRIMALKQKYFAGVSSGQ